MRVTALAGGVGAGKLLRGLVRAVDPAGVTAIVNVADDMTHLGLHISPDLDSVTYWLAGVMDRERGWGRAGESFRAMDALEQLAGESWFSLGDLDLATHLYRTQRLREGARLSEVTAEISDRLGVPCRVLAASDDPVRTWLDVTLPGGEGAFLPFQRYWVEHRAEPAVRAIHFLGADEAAPAPVVLEAIEGADAVLLCPSNPVVSLLPILAIPGIREAVEARRDRVVGISPIVGGAPLAGMADKVMPALGLEVSAAGAAEAYRGLLGAWLIDEADADLAPKIEERDGIRCVVTDTIMTDDAAAERLVRAALEALP